jgi:predicted neutral ceramidase superfamily lipid hydrolase
MCTWSFSHNSYELQDDSSIGMFGSKSALTLTAEDDEANTTRTRAGFFRQERDTFSVPWTARSKISACILDKN